MDFGNYAIIQPVEHRFEKEGGWWWKIKPPTSGDEYEINRFLVQNRVMRGPDGIEHEYPPTFTEIAYREIALLFGGTNIPAAGKAGTPVEEGGAVLVAEGARVEAVEAVLRKLPHAMVMEIWGAIADTVPGWGPQRPKARTSPTPPSSTDATE
jgi:hypothetical protein